MAKVIKKMNLSAESSTEVNEAVLKGTPENPYTQEEMTTFGDGTWPGGFVEGMGYLPPSTTINGSNSNIGSYDDDNTNEYSRTEALKAIQDGNWHGGFVEGLRYILPNATNLPNEPIDITNGNDILSRAKTFENAPYKYGGLSYLGIDCSGLVIAACNLSYRWATSIGAIPGLTQQNISHTSPTFFISNLQIGDVLVWNSSTNHAVIYEGDGKIFHAHSSGVNTTSDLQRYWIATYGYPIVYRKISNN